MKVNGKLQRWVHLNRICWRNKYIGMVFCRCSHVLKIKVTGNKLCSLEMKKCIYSMHCQLPIEGVLHKALDWGYTQTNIVYDLCVFGSYYQTENNSYSTRCIYGKPTVFTRTRSIIIMNTISNKWIKTIQDQTNNYVTNQKFKSKAFDVSIHLNYFSLYRYNWFRFISLSVSKWCDVSLSNFV